MVTQVVRRVVTYERVSSEDQRERETIRTQTEEIARWLSADPLLELIDRYVDDGVSGTTPFAQRPAGRRLLADAARGCFQEVWVYRIDRLGRDDVDPLLVRRDLERMGVTVHSVTEGASDPFVYSIHVAVAAQERRTFLARSAAGMDRAAREGRYTGGIVPLGYRLEGRKPHVYLVPSDTVMWADLTEADVVRRIYRQLVIDQWSCRRIADELNALGIPTAYQKDGRGVRGERTQGRWRPGRIRNLVVNTVYRGELRYGRRSTRPGGREVISAPVAALVSEEIWYAARETLARNRIMPKNGKRPYLLRSVIRCGTDGLTYCGSMSNGAVWYRCTGQLVERGPVEGRCPSKSVKGEQLEPVVWSDIEVFLRNPGDILSELETECSSEASGAVAEAESVTLSAVLVDLDAQRKRALDVHIRGRLSSGEIDAFLGRIDADRAEIERRLAALRPHDSEHEDVENPEITPDLLEKLNRRLDGGLSDDERQEIVRLLVRRITVHTEMLDGKRRARAAVEYRFPSVVSTCKGTREGQNYTLARRVVRL